MSDPLFHILSAVAFIFVIEGLVYAIFPDKVKRMMAMALSLGDDKLRSFGVAMALLGVMMAWIFQQLH